VQRAKKLSRQARAGGQDEEQMDETQQRDGEVLNWLLQGANDSAQGFRQGVDLARNPRLKSLFMERAQQREQLAGQLAAEVRSFEHPPSERGTVVGEAHRAFTYLRDAISQDSDKGLVEELLRRERALGDKFQSAVQDAQLPSHARSVAATALPGFTETTDELAKIGQEFSGTPQDREKSTGRFELNDADNRFLAVPAGAAVLSAGSSGTEGRIQRSEETVVRIGIQSVAVATSQGGRLSLSIEAGGNASSGHDGPGQIEQHLTASGSLEVLVKAGDALAFKAWATPEDAQLLRTVVWSIDVAGAALNQVGVSSGAEGNEIAPDSGVTENP
jgi:uncharacterized protein (TIGR02284 family)